MKNLWKAVVVVLLAGAVAGVLAVKYTGKSSESPEPADARATTGPALPQLLDFGMGKCTQCKIMNGIMKQLRAEYPGRLKVRLVDIDKEEAVADAYSIQIIPAQVFLAPDGTELDRNEGLMSKEEIVGNWARLGYDLGKPVRAGGGD